MGSVFAALLPAAAVGVLQFGLPALRVLLCAVAGAWAAGTILRRLRPGRAQMPVGEAAAAGLVLGLALPASSPAWLALAGGSAALAAGTGFRGFARGVVSPALAARVLLLLLFPGVTTAWTFPAPFAALRAAGRADAQVGLLDAFMGRVPGGVGETSALALLLGAAFLLRRRAMTWQTPAAFAGALAACAWLGSAADPWRFAGPGSHLLTGGFLLGALFLTTDFHPSPLRPRGRLVHGAGCGVCVWLLRSFGDPDAAVSFAIALMALVVPLIRLYAGADAARAEDDGGG